MGLLYGENCMILTSTVFDWSTRVTDRQMDRQTDRWNCHSICALTACCRAQKPSEMPRPLALTGITTHYNNEQNREERRKKIEIYILRQVNTQKVSCVTLLDGRHFSYRMSPKHLAWHQISLMLLLHILYASNSAAIITWTRCPWGWDYFYSRVFKN